MDRRQRELYAKQQQLLREQRTADQEKLLAAIGGNLGFHEGRPVAATTIFRCCLQWKTFQADRTPLFDRIIATMGSQVGAAGGRCTRGEMTWWKTEGWPVERRNPTLVMQLGSMQLTTCPSACLPGPSQVELHQEDNATLAYWLSNTVTLLYLMQKNVKPASGGGYAARIKASSQQVRKSVHGCIGSLVGM